MIDRDVARLQELEWKLLYTRPHAETWAAANLARQGYQPLLPRVASRSGTGPLFRRYLFVGHERGREAASLRGTYGVQYVVQYGGRPAVVPLEVIDEIRGRMDAHGLVHLEQARVIDPLFARRERERLDALHKFIDAGFRVKVA